MDFPCGQHRSGNLEKKMKHSKKTQYMVDKFSDTLYIVICHVVVRATEGASGSKGRSRKSPIFL